MMKVKVEKVCPICQFEFMSSDDRKIYCGRKCANKASGNRRLKGGTHSVEKTCKNCGGAFVGYVAQKYCPKCQDYRICKVEGCDRQVTYKGSTGKTGGNLCIAHYTRQRRGQTMEGPVKEYAPNGTGFINKDGYCIISVNGRKWFRARLVMTEKLERELLTEENVHHKNGVRDDDRPENLELWSTSQPPGQRVSDKVAWAKEILALYDPESLAQ